MGIDALLRAAGPENGAEKPTIRKDRKEKEKDVGSGRDKIQLLHDAVRSRMATSIDRG